ncbi:hypothetical protein YC2023_011691 [Brassica napus]
MNFKSHFQTPGKMQKNQGLVPNPLPKNECCKILGKILSYRIERTIGMFELFFFLMSELLDLSESVNRDKGGRGNNVHTANTEPSVVIMDKTKSTKSDLVKEEERRVSKKDIVKEYCHAKGERERKLDASQQSPFLGNSTAKQVVPTKNVGHGYDPFAPVDKKNAKVLLDFLKKDP